MHIDEHLLEQYLLNPQNLSPQQRQHVEHHLEECQSCRSIYEYLREYYRDLEKTNPPKLPWLKLFSDDQVSTSNG